MEALEQRLEEVEVLLAIFPDELTLDEDALARNTSYFAEYEGHQPAAANLPLDLPAIALTIALGEVADKDGSVFTSAMNAASFKLAVALPARYPADEPPTVEVEVTPAEEVKQRGPRVRPVRGSAAHDDDDPAAQQHVGAEQLQPRRAR